MNTFLVIGMQFSIILSLVMVVSAYMLMVISWVVWFFARMAYYSLRQGSTSLVAYTDKTTSVLQASNLQKHKIIEG